MNIFDVESNGDTRFGSFAEKEDRSKFVRGVFCIMFLMLLLTSIQAGLVYFIEPLTAFFIANYWLMIIGFIFYITATIMLCVKTVRKQHPWNLILLLTLVEGMTIIVIYSILRYDLLFVFMALVITSGVCLIVAIFAMFCPIDLTGCTLLIMVLSIVTSIFSLVMIITLIFYQNKVMMIIYCFIIVAVTCLYLAYDIQLIIGGRSHELEPDEYVLGACILYIDIVIIFLYILNLQNLLN